MPKGWIAIFKPGTHTDAAGNTNTWTEDDVKKMADLYNNQPETERHDAPIVKGHPQTDDPAMGWVEKLKYEGGKLWAKAKEVNKDFADEVKKGAYKKVSVRLYPNKLLRHVGYLGAVPPAVKGLGDAMLTEYACFNDDESDHKEFFEDVELEFADDKTTVEQLKKEQEARSKKYGISVNSAKGLIQKPEHYSTLTDDDFADPIHYRFPIHDQANTIVSLSSFNRYENRNEYTEDERQIIGSRLINSATKFKIDSKTNDLVRFMYQENDTQNNSNFINNYGENEVDEEMKKLRDSFIAKVKDDTNEEVATKVSKHFADVFSAKSAPKKTDDTKTKKDDEDTKLNAPSFEESDAFKRLQAENKAMQDKMRNMEFEEFLNSDHMRERVTRSTKDGAMAMLEIAYNSSVEFSEDGKSINPVEKVKKHLMSLPPIVDLGKIQAPEFSENEYAEQDKSIEEFNKGKGL